MDKPILLPKKEVNYSKDGGDTPCAGCANFIAPNACGVVEGNISENGTCDMYEPKGQEGGQEAIMAALFGGANVQ